MGHCEWAVRPVRVEDVHPIWRLCQGEGWDTTLADIEDFFACPAWGMTAVSGDEVVGTATAFIYPPLAFIGNVIVAPGFRGRGLGTMLVSALVSDLRRRGVYGAVLEARPGLESFYRHLGFRSFDRTVRYALELPARLSRVAECPPPGMDGSVIATDQGMVREICRFDVHSFGTDRSCLLQRLQRRAVLTLARLSEGRVQGYLMVRPAACGFRLGPWVDTDSSSSLLLTALSMLPTGSGAARVTVASPARPEVMAAFEAVGFRAVGMGERMCVGLDGGRPFNPAIWALAGLDRG